MRNKYIAYFLALLVCSFTSVANASIYLERNRIIFSAENKKANIVVVNKENASSPYLVQAVVEPEVLKEGGKTPFVVTPSLFRIEKNNKQSIAILANNPNLPQDRESVFYFKATSIPAGKKGEGLSDEVVVEGQVKVASVLIIKLFYRPAKLNVLPQVAKENLVIKSQPKGIKVINNSPYYMSLSKLKVNNTAITLDQAKPESLIPPFGERAYPSVPNHGEAELEIYNDLGGRDNYKLTIK
ncbi:molecular chaperone [Providencia alcalifaciens]|nr:MULTISPECIES: molecular chaperone [Providencia]EJD6083036.1 molecular chaperone [Providencia rettgeri]EJD6400700.1 molecular chaperone [Providencia rettgeri]EJD6584534.1 molecular chaperone [Providencia rettgeri]EJD6613062.1 molecular chaperone [Providencia rettgeri]ELL9150089.1 molecular chaperone [Providencia rettgeri]